MVTQEMGKPIAESEAEIEKCAWTCEFYAATRRDSSPTSMSPQRLESGVVFDPLGVVLAIMPWNYPFWQFFRFVAPRPWPPATAPFSSTPTTCPHARWRCEEIMESRAALPACSASLLIGQSRSRT